MKIPNFRHKLAFKQVVRFKVLQYICDALTFLLDNIFIRFGTKLYRQVVGIPMGTNCAPLVAGLFLFSYERGFMMSLSDEVNDAFNDFFCSGLQFYLLSSPYLCFISLLYLDLYVLGDDVFIS